MTPESSRSASIPSAHKEGSSLGMVAVIVVLSLLGAGTWWLVRTRQAAAAAKAGGPNRAGFEIPVVEGVVARRDLPLYLDGLGTVQAFNAVTVRARVEGLLRRVIFTEGQEVKAGDLLAEIDPIPFEIAVQQAEGKQAEDAAKLENARAELVRDEGLVERKILSAKEFEDQKALVLQLTATVRSDHAASDQTRVQLGYTRILSPIDGRTGIRQIDAGNLVRAGDSNGIVVVSQLRPISVLFTLPEQALAQITAAQATGQLEVQALDRDNTVVAARGILTVVDNQIDSTTGTVRIKARFENADLRLWPGQFVNTRLLVRTQKDAVVVPTTVVQRGPDGPFAFVIGSDSTVAMRAIRTGRVQDGWTQIESGLTAGERVVVDGQYKLQNGSKVRTGPPKNPGGPEGAKPAGSRTNRPAAPGENGNPAAPRL